MSKVAELTAAEAGFAFGWVKALQESKTERSAAMIDEISAGPLRTFLQADGAGPEELAAHSFGKWIKSETGDLQEELRPHYEVLCSEEAAPVEKRLARMRIERRLEQVVADFTPLAKEEFDLRVWLEGDEAREVTRRLVILGGALVGTVEVLAVRRKLAATLAKLPEPVVEKIRACIAGLDDVDDAVSRRIYEVYCRLAKATKSAEQELATMGLYFLISAAIFRQNRAVKELAGRLPAELARQVQPFCRACLQSGKPHLSPLVAQVVARICTEMTNEEEEPHE